MVYTNISRLIGFFAIALLSYHNLDAQEKFYPFTVVLKNKDFTFNAQSYNSTSVGRKQLNDNYYVIVKSVSIIGLLPYFGKSYTPQINVTDGSIQFTSLKFDYTLVEKKKGKCEVAIKPKDPSSSIQELFLIVFSDGNAQIEVTSKNKDPMTFYGYISQ